jgi:hypothetical protein
MSDMEALRTLGWSLVRIGVVVAALVALSMMAIPRCDCRNGPRSEEAVAIATLRHLHGLQQQFLASKVLDRDGDGLGEAGTFSDLAASGWQLQKSLNMSPAASIRTKQIADAFTKMERGRLHHRGYFFQLYLPAKHGPAKDEPATDEPWISEGTPTRFLLDVDASELGSCICAWPDGADDRPRSAFFLDGGGAVWTCNRREQRYAGTIRPMPAVAAMPLPGMDHGNDRGHAGRDGQRWEYVY